MSRPLLEVREVSVSFGRGRGAVEAVRNVSLTVGEKEAVGIVGESGSGKSSIARVIVGALEPDHGEVLVRGESLETGLRARKKTRDGAQSPPPMMVFQDPYDSLNPRMTALSTVAEAFRVWHRLSRPESRESALELLNSIGIGSTDALKRPHELSGGQRQRVSVARALAPAPNILVADEPTSAIDQSAQAQLLNLLKELQTRDDLSIVFISHDLGVVRYLTSRVYVMRNGEVVESGATSSIFDNPQHDYTKLLLRSVPGTGERREMVPSQPRPIDRSGAYPPPQKPR